MGSPSKFPAPSADTDCHRCPDTESVRHALLQNRQKVLTHHTTPSNVSTSPSSPHLLTPNRMFVDFSHLEPDLCRGKLPKTATKVRFGN